MKNIKFLSIGVIGEKDRKMKRKSNFLSIHCLVKLKNERIENKTFKKYIILSWHIHLSHFLSFSFSIGKISFYALGGKMIISRIFFLSLFFPTTHILNLFSFHLSIPSYNLTLKFDHLFNNNNLKVPLDGRLPPVQYN